MSLKERLDADIKRTMLAGERDKADVLRGLKSAILYEEVAQKSRDTGLDDAAIEKVVARECKKREEAAALYDKGGSPDRAAKERSERDILSAYLPAQLDDAALDAEVSAAIADQGQDAHVGKLIGAVKARVGNSADGARIAAAVQRALKG
ncbi:GatB/YqeY domain-containing protein [Candidatus Saccharibacteria bacterium]|nr:GatB/YqeY domain-containing protein [Candidatus Saccharibacteria bacterium]